MQSRNNQLSNLDVKNCKNLIYLECNYNQLESLDLSNNTSLVTLVAYGNKFDENALRKKFKIKKI